MDELPLHLADLINRLSEAGKLFIELYIDKKERMRAVASELEAIATKVTTIQSDANSGRIFGAVLGGLGVVGFAAALLAGGLSTDAGKLGLLAGGLAMTGGAGSIVTVNAVKAEAEKISLKTVEELVKEFMTIIELQKAVLEEVKHVSEELHRQSSALMTTTAEQAHKSLQRTERLQRLLRPLGQLAKQSSELISANGTALTRATEVLNIVITLAQITPTHEEDEKLRRCITDCASQCGKTVAQFAKMRNVLRDFEGMQEH